MSWKPFIEVHGELRGYQDTLPLKGGDKVRLPRGIRRGSTRPKERGIVHHTGLSYTVTVNHTLCGTNALLGSTVKTDPQVRWVGSGGYWFDANINEVLVEVQDPSPPLSKRTPLKPSESPRSQATRSGGFSITITPLDDGCEVSSYICPHCGWLTEDWYAGQFCCKPTHRSPLYTTLRALTDQCPRCPHDWGSLANREERIKLARDLEEGLWWYDMDLATARRLR